MPRKFERRFAEEEGIIYAEGATFRGSQVFALLQAIEKKLARQVGENALERAQALALMSELQRRRQGCGRARHASLAFKTSRVIFVGMTVNL